MKLGAHIREARKAKKWTQLQLAEAIGVSVQAISQWERDETNPGIDRIKDLSKHLDMKFMFMFLDHEYIAAPVSRISNFKAKSQRIPVIREGDITRNIANFDDFLSQENHSQININGKAEGKCFAYTLNYDALNAGFERGELLIFDTGVSPLPGDWICVNIHDIEQIFLARYAHLSQPNIGIKTGIVSQIRDLNHYILLDPEKGDYVVATLIERRRIR